MLKDQRQSWISKYLPGIVLIWVFFAQLILGSLQLSITADEPTHIVNGYVSLTTGDTWALPVHKTPPLLNAWSAWPILLQPDRPDPRLVPEWHQRWIPFIRSILPLLGPPDRLAFATRLPIILLAVALMSLVYRWAADWFGHWGGVLAMAIMAWDPTMIAHSQLSTTDLGLTLFTFACLYLTSRLLRRFTWRLLVGVGLLLGLAMATKNTGLMLVPLLAAMLGGGYVRETGGQWRAWLHKRKSFTIRFRQLTWAAGRWVVYFVLLILVGGLVLWASYRFERSVLPGTSMPLPLASHIRMLESFSHYRYAAFLCGQTKWGGWWWYFPFAFAVKSPIPHILGVGVILALMTRRKWRLGWDEMVLWAFPILYWAVVIQNKIDIGYRHMLPTFPFVYVGLARLSPWLLTMSSRWRHVARWTAAILGVWYIVGTLRVYPFGLAYFNELVGGPQNGYHYLADSNVAWGQSFKALKAYMDKAGIESVRLSYFTTQVDPAVYGVRYEPLPPATEDQRVTFRRYNPEPGIYVISASTLHGIMMMDWDVYEWFRHRDPVAQPGYGLLVYNVPVPVTPRTWVAECTAPYAPLDAEQMASVLEQADLRLAYFDCTTSWLYPTGGKSPGWIVLSQDAPVWTQRYLSSARLSYEQKHTDFSPSFRMYEEDDRLTYARGSQVRVAPSPLGPAEAAAVPPLELPVAFEGGLTLLGYTLDQAMLKPGETANLETVWRVDGVPGRLLSIMAHTLGPDGRVIAAGDGLGVAIENWQTGDVFIQRHRLTVPMGTLPGLYWVQTGVYWLDSGERWPVRDDRASGDRVLLVRLLVR